MAENTEHVINLAILSLSIKQGNSGRVTVTQADWIMSLDLSFPERFFQSPRCTRESLWPCAYEWKARSDFSLYLSSFTGLSHL